MIFHDIEQNSDEWYNIRLGKITSSKSGLIMANGDNFGEPAKKYALRIAIESIKKEQIEESFSDYWTELGHAREPIARELYEIETFSSVSNGGFCESDNVKNFGGSPDGLILEDNGAIEIKSVKYTTHYKTIKRGSFDPVYKWQMLANMFICDLEYIDFVSYCPEFTENKTLFIDRLLKQDYLNELDQLEEKLNKFNILINQIKENL